ncbi:F-box domain-containing protein [Xylaria intraflava]|nr:F-box domain-containing protein [Xylaria intraflava]
MSNLPLDPEILISCLSSRSRHLSSAMISIACPPNPPYSKLADRVSSLGILNRLPPEIMSIILGMLDIQSIARFARVSLEGNMLVKSQRPYRDLVTFAPHVLLALGRMGLIGLHSVAELHASLRTEQCTACTQYGAFLFLPTCERCCWECLRYNPSLRVLLPGEAKIYFGLSEWQVRRLPTLHVIPGNYGIVAEPAPKRCGLVSVKAARVAGLKVRGSTEKLAQAMARRCQTTKLLTTGQYLQGGPTVSRGQDFLSLPSQGNIPPDKFFGMASIPFPSLLKSGRIEHGLWCRGCEYTRHRYESLQLSRDTLAAIVPSNCEPRRVLLGMERRAWSKEAFLDHIKHCYGARQLIPELANGSD